MSSQVHADFEWQDPSSGTRSRVFGHKSRRRQGGSFRSCLLENMIRTIRRLPSVVFKHQQRTADCRWVFLQPAGASIFVSCSSSTPIHAVYATPVKFLNLSNISSRTLRKTANRDSSSPSAAAGSSKLQWMRSVLPGNTGHCSFALSQTVMT